MTTIIGVKATSFVASGIIVDNQIRGLAPPSFVAPEAGWITHLGGFLKNSSGPGIYFAIYALDNDGTPAQLLGRTARFSVNNISANFEFPIVWAAANLGGTQSAVRLAAGQRFAIALRDDSGSSEISLVGGSTMHWVKSISGSGPPPDPFLPTSTASAPVVALYGLFEPNRKPSVALSTPANGAALGSNPTFTGTFSDLDSGVPALDKMSRYAIEVTRQSDGFLMWGGSGAVFNVSATERATGVFNRLYAGATIPSGSGPYQWRARVFDDTGTPSDWSAPRTFTMNLAGQVDISDATTPIAKVDSNPAQIDWGGRWHHPTGLDAKAFQVRIIQDEAVVKLGSVVTQSVASSALPGTSFTIDDTVAGIGALTPGSYYYQIQGQATDNQWSPWSDPKEFVVNSPPTTPSNLQPPNGSSSTSRPLAEFNVIDPDPDDIEGVDVDFEILLKRPNATQITIISTNYDQVTGKGFHQFTSSEVLDAVRGRYTWQVRGRDTSGGSFGIGQWSQPSTFDYVSGPVPSISAPVAGSTVSTSVPTVAWTVTGAAQARFEVKAYEVDAPNAFKSSGQIVSTANTYQIPAGWLKNNGEYDVDVSIWDGSNNKGTSLRRQFKVSYSGPVGLLNPEASLYANRFDPVLAGAVEPSSLLISWEPSNLPPGEFGGYLVRRRKLGEDITASVELPPILAIGQSRWIDHLAPPNTPLIYTISQLRRVSQHEVLESPSIEVQSELPRSTPILCSAREPGSIRFPAMWLSNDLSGDFERDQSIIKTWGAKGRRTNTRQPAAYGARSVQVGVIIRADERGTLYDHLDVVDDLVESGHTLCWGPERPRERMFCALEGRTPWKRDGDTRTRRFSLIEVDWTEGVSEEE